MVDHALHDTGVVAQVDEGEVLAVLPATGHPAADRHRPADVAGAQSTAVVGAHHCPRRPFTLSTTSSSLTSSSPLSPPVSDCTLAIPRSNSSGPITTASRAPERLASLNWAFIERPSKARSVRTPAPRSSWTRPSAAEPVTST